MGKQSAAGRGGSTQAIPGQRRTPTTPSGEDKLTRTREKKKEERGKAAHEGEAQNRTKAVVVVELLGLLNAGVLCAADSSGLISAKRKGLDAK